MNKTVKRVLLIVLAVLVVVALIFGIYYFIQKQNNKMDIDVSAENGSDIIALQAEIDKKIQEYIDDESIKIDNPKVIKNPYKVSPLTALIIFYTDKEVSYSVYLNNQLLTKIESSKKHSIPIFGLLPDRENMVILKGNDNSYKEIKIDVLNNSYNTSVDLNKTDGSNYYFISTIDDPGTYAIDSNGQTVWFLNLPGGQDLEFLSNGHMLVSNGSVSGMNSFTGFYEIDFFGKIYKSYSLKNNYHHEVNELSDGNLIVAGDKLESKFSEGYIYIINKDNGEEISSLDLYDLFANVDESYTKTLGSFDIWINVL